MKLSLETITVLFILPLTVFSSCTFKKKTAVKFLIPLASSSTANTSSSNLTSLIPSAGSLSPSFSSTVYSYSISVGSAVSSIQFTPTASDSSAAITVNGASVASGSLSSVLPLTTGTNTVTVTVSVSSSSSTYTITVTRNAASANLSSLTASPMSFYPSFSSSTTAYSATVSNSVSSITLTPAVTDPSASVTVNGTAVSSGSPSGGISLSAGTNSITIAVTAADGSVSSYSLTVYRLSATQKRLFVTSSSYNGNLGGPTGADTKCNADSNKPADGSTYKAVLSDAASRMACSTANCTLVSENVNWPLGANLTYLRSTDGSAVFISNSAGIFIFGTLTAPVESSGSNDYWTSINANWTSIGSHCSGWTASTGSGRVGTSDQTNSNAIFSGSSGCSNSNRLLCAEQ